MDSSPGDSPTGLLGVRPADILRDRYRPGNSESVRQLSLRVRLAEEKANRFRKEKDDLKAANERLNRELEENKSVMINLRKEYQERVEELERQIRENKYQGSKTRVQDLFSLFETSTAECKTYAPLFQAPEKVSVDASVCTEPEAGCSKDSPVFKQYHDQGVIADFGDHYQVNDDPEDRAKLESDNFFLETQLKLARSKLDRYGLQEIQKKDLEKRTVALSEIIDRLIAENEKLKEMAASKMNDGTGSTAATRKVIDVTLEYQSKLDSKVAELELRTKQLEELTRIHNTALANLDCLREKYKSIEEKLAECSAGSSTQQAENVSKDELQKYMEENAELRERLLKYEPEPEPASETTRILHFRMNPLDVAHQEYKEFESKRKRKAEVSMLCDADGLDAALRKKQRDELLKQVADLQFQLHKSEKEKERALKIQSDLVKHYRAIVTALSGWQIKMKDEGFAQIESIFNPGQFFVFKVENFGKSVSLLETEYANKWSNQIHEYLEGRDSVPAFLAAVTLVLDEQSQSTQYTLSFSSSD